MSTRRWFHLAIAVVCVGLGLGSGAGTADLVHLLWPNLARPAVALPVAVFAAITFRTAFYRLVLGGEK